jgi:hypothetical protein
MNTVQSHFLTVAAEVSFQKYVFLSGPVLLRRFQPPAPRPVILSFGGVLARGAAVHAFLSRLIGVTAERKTFSYPLSDGRNILVTQAEFPFEVYLGWDKFTAKITYRHALAPCTGGERYAGVEFWRRLS